MRPTLSSLILMPVLACGSSRVGMDEAACIDAITNEIESLTGRARTGDTPSSNAHHLAVETKQWQTTSTLNPSGKARNISLGIAQAPTFKTAANILSE